MKEPDPLESQTGAAEPVWSYRGYRLRGSDFNTAMVHLFRAEVQRANVWRSRLDTTTNWAVVTTGAALSIGYSQPQSDHVVILINLLLVTMFLLIEGRRYRYYELWSYRVRLMETDFFAAMLVPPFHPSPDWAETLSETLLHPQFPISQLEAIGRRLRRNYIYIYLVMGLAWVFKLWLYPQPVLTFSEFASRAQVGFFRGEFVLLVTLAFYTGIIIISVFTIGLQQAAGEVLPRFGISTEAEDKAAQDKAKVRAWFRPSRHRPQFLTYIITDQAQEVSDRVIGEMNRGVTKLNGVGMYTGASHSVLLVALTVTEIPRLKSLVHKIDPKAFVVVSPAQDIFGRGFFPLGEE